MGEYPAGDRILLRRKALDILQASMIKDAAPEPRIVARCELPLTLTRKERTKATVLGVGDFTLNNANQGIEIEKLTILFLDDLFRYAAEYRCAEGTA